jgi:hypothetical protein
MATTVTAADVLKCADLTLTTDDIDAAILTADRLTTELDLVGEGLGTDMLFEVQKFLAAHFAQMKERQTKSEDVAQEIDAKFMGKDDFGLYSTIHGQQAIAMDLTGLLASFAKGRKRASLQLLVSEYDDWVRGT